MSDALDNSFAAVATYNDSGNTWGEEGLVDLSAVETAATAVGGGEILSVNSSDADSSDDEDSKESVPLFGVDVYGSPTFSLDNDQMADSPTEMGNSPTDSKVSKYSFYSRLTHYMDGHKIRESNRAAVELCLLSEAGAFVRNMDPMKKDIKERAFFAKYILIVDEIEDDQFVDKALVREKMRRIYKGAKKDHTAQSLWRKYEQELTLLRTFAKKILGIGNLAELPSGSTQLRHMKTPLVQSLRKEKNPVRNYCHLTSITLFLLPQRKCCDSQNVAGVDYNDPFSVQSEIDDDWWLTNSSCKYMLCCLVRKDCKDINIKPCEQPPGRTRVLAREAKSKVLVAERAIAKSDRPVEKYGDVDHQLKKVRLSGMQAHTKKIMVDTIGTQKKKLKKNADVYKSVHGKKGYNELLVSLITKMTGLMNKRGTMPSSARLEDYLEDNGDNE